MNSNIICFVLVKITITHAKKCQLHQPWMGIWVIDENSLKMGLGTSKSGGWRSKSEGVRPKGGERYLKAG